MRQLQVSILTLTNAGSSRPSQANSFFPQHNQNDHIHFGASNVFTNGADRNVAEEGNVFISYVSFKKNGAFWFRLIHNPLDGYFSFPNGKRMTDLPLDWQRMLTKLGIVR